MTKIEKVEQIKKDFVDNVSHELRTHLASIKGFVETLEDGAEGENRYFLKIIKRNTNRLINIVQDLMILSKLEEKENEKNLDFIINCSRDSVDHRGWIGSERIQAW